MGVLSSIWCFCFIGRNECLIKRSFIESATVDKEGNSNSQSVMFSGLRREIMMLSLPGAL